MKTFTLKALFILIVIIANTICIIYAQTTVYSTGTHTGWNATGAWTGGKPSENDTVVILNGHTIELGGNVEIAKLVVEGTLLMNNNNSSRSLTVTDSLRIAASGIITNNTSANGNHVNNLSIGGHFLNNGVFSARFNNVITNVILTGSIAQNVLGNPIIFENLTMNSNSGIANLQMPVIVNGNLNLVKGIIYSDATNYITMGINSSVTGGNDASHVDGIFAQAVKGITSVSKPFPVGKNGNGRKFTLNFIPSNTDSTVYAVEQMEGNPPNSSSLSGLVSISKIRYFNLTKLTGNAGLTAATVNMNYGVDDMVSAPLDLRIAYFEDLTGNWISLGGVGSGSPLGSITSVNAFTQTNYFTLGSLSGNNPLPVELISFTAEFKNKKVYLNWTTASEKNNSLFEVQRNTDGEEWMTIGFKKGHGNSNRQVNYTIIDGEPSGGTNNYRLRQVDYDGQFEYSEIAVVNAEMPVVITLSENPVTNNEIKVYFEGLSSDDQSFEITLFNIEGQVMYKNTIANSKVADIDASGFTNGIYFINITSNNFSETQRLIIKN